MFKKFVLFVCLLCLPFAAEAGKRLGLVIGNDSYVNVPVLLKARSDASALAETLSDLGFEVTEVLDADRRDMNRAIAEFTARLQPGDTAMVFFAGHGVEIDGENYLLPVDIEAPDQASPDFIKFESIGLSDVLLRVQNTGARTTLMFIDACRDNPFAESTGRSIGGSRGLARVTAPEGTFVVFSAGARQQALDRLSDDDPNPNSVFTRILLPKLRQPGLELRTLISDVRVQVRDLALLQNHQQFPAYYDELLGSFYFNDAPPFGRAPEQDDTGSEQPQVSALEKDYARARSLDTVLAYEAFLEKHRKADDLTISIATRRLDALRRTGDGLQSEKEEERPSEYPEALDFKEIIRQSQSRLNALGCSAGGADGVVGPRTRRAFAAFIEASEASLQPSDLGSQKALDILNTKNGTVCVAVVAAPKPVEKAEPTSEVAAVIKPKIPQVSSLSGTWRFTAQCPLLIRASGTSTLRSIGEKRYSITTRDNLGNVANGTVTEGSGGVLRYRVVWQTGMADNYSAKLSGSRNSISGTSSVGCRFTARR